MDKSLNLARVLNERRLKAGRLAELSGVSSVTISRLVNNRTKPQVRTLVRIADALGCRVGDLCGGKVGQR